MRLHTVGNIRYYLSGPQMVYKPLVCDEAPKIEEFSNTYLSGFEYISNEGRRDQDFGAVYISGRLHPHFLEMKAHQKAAHSKVRRADPDVSDPDPSARLLRGRSLYLGTFKAHFGHFLIETLARCWSIGVAAEIDNYVFHGRRHPLAAFETKFLRGAGLDPEKIRWIKAPTICETLVYPDTLMDLRWKISRYYPPFCDGVAEKMSRDLHSRSIPRKIYFTRRNLEINPSRLTYHVANEEKVERLFEDRGFTVLAPETLPIDEQLALVRDATHIAGLYGSALHLSLFCRNPHLTMICLATRLPENQAIIDAGRGYAAHHIYCTEGKNADGGRLRVNKAKLAMVLDAIL